jgi:cell division protease FtsH
MKKAARPAQQGFTYQGGRPREEDMLTRRKLPFWDRVKWLLLLAVIWLILVWSLMADNPLVGFADALRIEVGLAYWVFILIGLELIHQAHFLISEHWAAYHQFWVHKVWGRSERFQERKLSAWTRYRIGRVIRWVILISVIAILAGKIMHDPPVTALLLVPAILWHAMPMVIQYAFLLFFTVAQFALLFWFMSRGGVDVYYPDDIKTRFSDVWGQDHVLERVKENIIFLENPEIVEDRGGYVPGGILLWGPPGTGKTLMAEAVAGETGRPYVFVDPGAFINMFMGVGILKVKGLFRKLRKLSLRYGGVIVFFDEADSLGNRGVSVGGAPGGSFSSPLTMTGCHGFSYASQDTQWRLFEKALHAHHADDQEKPPDQRVRQILPVGGNMAGGMGGMGTLQSLLTELSGLKKPRGFFNRVVRRALGMRPKPPPHYRIMVMMATNMVSTLDPALLRPGRIDRIYRVGYPAKEGRVRTFEGYLAKVSHELTAEQIDKLATISPYATGAMIKDLVNEALIIAIGDGRDVITYQDVIRAKQLKELGPPEDVEYIERERHAVAVHEACHAVLAYRTMHHKEIDLATIEKGSDYLGMVKPVKPEDQYTTWRSEFESDIQVFLASLAGERMFFDEDNSSGVSGDLEAATTIAALMEGFFGMGQTVSSLSAGQRLQTGTPGGRGKGTQEDVEAVARRMLADRIEDNLTRLLEGAAEALRENERYVLAVAHALETHKTVSGEDIAAIFEGQRGPLVDGAAYQNDAFIDRLREYHEAAKRAHKEHSRPDLPLPVPEPVLAIADGFGSGDFFGDNGNGNGTSTSTEAGETIDFGGFGAGNPNGNGSYPGPLGAPTYDPPGQHGPDDTDEDDHS